MNQNPCYEFSFIIKNLSFPTKEIHKLKNQIQTTSLLEWIKYFIKKNDINFSITLFNLIYDRFINHIDTTETILDFFIENKLKPNLFTYNQQSFFLDNLKIKDSSKLNYFDYLIERNSNIGEYEVEHFLNNIEDKTLLIKYLSYNVINTRYTPIYESKFVGIIYKLIEDCYLSKSQLDEINSYFLQFLFLNKNNILLDIEVERHLYNNNTTQYWFLLIKNLLQKHTKYIKKYFRQYYSIAKENPDMYLLKQLILYLGKELHEHINFNDVYKYAIKPIYNTHKKEIYLNLYQFSDKNINIYLTTISKQIPECFKQDMLTYLENINEIVKNKFNIKEFNKQLSFFFGDKEENQANTIIVEKINSLKKEFNEIFDGLSNKSNYYSISDVKTISHDNSESREILKTLNSEQAKNNIINNTNSSILYNNQEYNAAILFIDNNYNEMLNELLSEINKNNFNNHLISIVLNRCNNKNVYQLLPDILFAIINHYHDKIDQQEKELLNAVTLALGNNSLYNEQNIDNTANSLSFLLKCHKIATADYYHIYNAERYLVENIIYLFFLKEKTSNNNYFDKYFNKLVNYKDIYIELLNKKGKLGDIYREIITSTQYSNYFNVLLEIDKLVDIDLKNNLFPFFDVNEYEYKAIKLLNNLFIIFNKEYYLYVEHTSKLIKSLDYIINNKILNSEDYKNIIKIFIQYILNEPLENKKFIKIFNKFTYEMIISSFNFLLSKELKLNIKKFYNILNKYLSKQFEYKTAELAVKILSVGFKLDNEKETLSWLNNNNFKISIQDVITYGNFNIKYDKKDRLEKLFRSKFDDINNG